MPTDEPTLERPRQVTMAGWLVVGGSVLVVLSAFERMSSLHSLETQEAIAEFLSRPPGDALGLSRDGAQSLLRGLVLVAGGTAAATTVLGIQAIGRSRAARVALSALAVPLLVAGMVVSGILVSLVVVAIVMLWLQPSRDWFNGVPSARAGTLAGPAFGRAPARPHVQRSVQPHVQPYDQPSAQPSDQPYDQPGGGTVPARPSAARPAAVTAACMVTWVTCGLALLVMALVVAVLLAAPEAVFDELRRQDPDFAGGGMSEAEVRRATFVGCGLAAVWCLAASGVAVATFQGYRWGWLALVVSTTAAGIFSALVMVGSLVLLAPMVAAAVTVGLLARPESRAWCRRSPRRHGSVTS